MTATVLLVDDNPGTLGLYTRVLRERGYEVWAARDGREALALGQWLPQLRLLVTDLSASAINGPALAAALRDAHPDLRVIYTHDDDDDAALVREAESSGGLLLAKPYTPHTLMEQVRRALRTAR